MAPTLAKQDASSTPPWRHSADAPEHSKGMSVDAAEFVPQNQAPAVRNKMDGEYPWQAPGQDSNLYMINMDQYSDNSESENGQDAPTKSCMPRERDTSSAFAGWPSKATKLQEAGASLAAEPPHVTVPLTVGEPAAEPSPSGEGTLGTAETRMAMVDQTESSSLSRLPPWKRANAGTKKDSSSASATTAAKEAVKPWHRHFRSTTSTPSTVTQGDIGSRPPPWRRQAKAKHLGDEAEDLREAEATSLGLQPEPKPVEEKKTEAPVLESTSPASESDLSGSEPEAEVCGQQDLDQRACTMGTFDINSMLAWRSAYHDACDSNVVFVVMDELLCMPSTSRPSVSSRSLVSGKSPPAVGAEHSQTEESTDSTLGRTRSRRPLQVSESSWAAQQRTRRGGVDNAGDTEVVRRIKSILNKLTLEKFSTLSRQLLSCGISTTTHVEHLIHEVFEKATMQHHFIEMYADLCVLLHENFIQSPVTDDPQFSFKRLLLNECQAVFERHLTPPDVSNQTDPDEKVLAEVRYKTRMIGNIRFIGALLARKMLATKVMMAILQELLGTPTPEALESLAVLLTAVGPTFDVPGWTHRTALNAIFEQVRVLVEKQQCEPRSRCLLKDVLELRQGGWQDRRPKKIEGPMTLGEVAEKAAEQEGTTSNNRQPRTPLVASTRSNLVQSVVPFDQKEYRNEVGKVLRELRATHDAAEAMARFAAMTAPPSSKQPNEFCNLLSQVAQEGRREVRTTGFQVAAKVFADSAWLPMAVQNGLQTFVDEVCEDLQYDVPSLPSILRTELAPALEPLVKKGLLQASQLYKLRNFGI